MLSPHALPRCSWPRSHRRCRCTRRSCTRTALGSDASSGPRSRTPSNAGSCTPLSPSRPAPEPSARVGSPTVPPWARMPRFRPAFCRTFRPGSATVPFAERVMPRTFRSSTRITSNRAARSVLVFSTQSLRRSTSRALSRAIAALVRARRFDPGRARASLRCNRTSRSASFGRDRAGLVVSPVDSATATATPRSRPTTSPVPGAGIGSGTAANAMCQRPARWVPDRRGAGPAGRAGQPSLVPGPGPEGRLGQVHTIQGHPGVQVLLGHPGSVRSARPSGHPHEISAGRPSRSSRSTSVDSNDPARRGFLPAPKDGVSTPDIR